MPIRYEDRTARFDGACTADEALPLLEWLDAADNGASVDLSACTAIHTALVQLLLAGRPSVAAEPTDPFLRRWVLPALRDAARC